LQGKHTGQLVADATAKKKKNTPHPHGARGAAGVGTDVPLPMPHVGLPGTAIVAPVIGHGK
jgi:hypothetical protein